MTIEKRTGGKYRITQMVNGKRYRITVDHKPSKREAEELIREQISQDEPCTVSDTFEKCAQELISSKDNILSPSTIREYSGTLARLTNVFKSIPVKDITQQDVQTEMNRHAADLAPKTVKNYHGFISSVLSVYRPSLALRTALPQKEKQYPVIPTDEEVKAVLEAVRASDYWVPFMLGCCALRRSEICALDLSDLDGNMLHIHRAKVRDVDGGLVIKNYPKTADSNRKIYIPDVLADRIRTQGYIFNYHPNQLLKRLRREQKHLNQRKYDFHALRKYYASMAHALGIPDKYIMQYGGWSSDHVMKSVYMMAMEDKVKAMQDRANNYMSDLFRG